MRSFTFNLESNWTKYLPFMLAKLGVYQGWLNSDAIMDKNKFMSSRYEYEHIRCVDDILKSLDDRSPPVAPALIVDKTKLDGTSTPSTQSSEFGKCWKVKDLGKEFGQLLKNENVENMRSFPFSSLNAPNMGEVNNLTPSLYLEPDPNHVNEFVAAVYIIDEVFHNGCIQRSSVSRNTRFESKNDPAWHYKDGDQFELLKMVNNDIIQSPITRLEDLNLKDKDGNELEQAFLDQAIDYLNGVIGIDMLSSKNTKNRQQQVQRNITTNAAIENKDVHRTLVWNLSQLDKIALHKIRLVNHLQKFGVAVFWVSTGTGPVSAEMRNLAALQAPIPSALFEDLERYRPVKEFFGLTKERPRYVDYLNETSNLFHITFKPQQGNLRLIAIIIYELRKKTFINNELEFYYQKEGS